MGVSASIVSVLPVPVGMTMSPVGRARCMGKRRMKRADLRTAQPARRRPTALAAEQGFPGGGRRPCHERPRTVVSRTRHALATIERADVYWRLKLSADSAFAKFKRLDDPLEGSRCARREQDKIGVQPTWPSWY